VSSEDNFVSRHYPFAKDFEGEKGHLKRIVEDWYAFVDSVDPVELSCYYPAKLTDLFPDFLEEKYSQVALEHYPGLRGRKLKQQALEELKASHNQGYTDFFTLTPIVEYYLVQARWFPDRTSRYRDWVEFKESLPPSFKSVTTATWHWHRYLLKQYGVADTMNKEWETDYAHIYTVPFFLSMPEKEAIAEDWKRFIKVSYPKRLQELDESLAGDYKSHLKEKFKTVQAYNHAAGSGWGSFDEMPFPKKPPENPFERNLWIEYIMWRARADKVIIHCPEKDYPAYLQAKYSDIAALNDVYGTSYGSFNEIELPLKVVDYYEYATAKKSIFWGFITSNYKRVLAFITTKGRALINTVILVTLSVLSALTVNPLAAYALSRFSLKSAHKILIFLLAPMAFPATVVLIPNFLLLRDLHLLNTFAALVLPGLANGFSIFLLKGFFDSLPRELYEAAMIDGSSELGMFWNITIPLSKPILAYIALMAFVASYSGFMWAFLVCQNEKMWTLMVWLYQFQQIYSAAPYFEKYLVMAAFVVASVPILLVFTFCQRVIMRGIILPSMK